MSIIYERLFLCLYKCVPEGDKALINLRSISDKTSLEPLACID